ncbi:hypothetical protein ACFQ09_24050 [Massilia norwichensis]|jgi:hypothetical protein|uniref:Uncharacterized protein n=1 Tax=Massilia norwichensis TaxID=1442366 RepID=A0ABT2A9H6_9BURK|nr:hypothetical protein [Massilia norwichensis]MCS0590858.1 hypothetical protein [Massilia norwichensis]
MHTWHASEESDLPLWVLDLDDEMFSVDHRRLCVWADEFDGSWRWEIQTYEHGGIADCGTAVSQVDAMSEAETTARRLAGNFAAEL